MLYVLIVYPLNDQQLIMFTMIKDDSMTAWFQAFVRLCFHLVLMLPVQSSYQWDWWLIHVFCFSFFFSVSQVQKQNYRQEKKRAAKELFSALKDPSVVIMSNWLKVRGCLVFNRATISTPRIVISLYSHWQHASDFVWFVIYTFS